MPELFQLLYVSQSTEEMTNESLGRIRDAGLRHNEPAGVYGVLLYRQGTFLQLLEGPQDAIESTLERIREDPRHTELRVLHRGPCETRTYQHYNMGVISEGGLPVGASVDLDRLEESVRQLADRDGPRDDILLEVIEQFVELSRLA